MERTKKPLVGSTIQNLIWRPSITMPTSRDDDDDITSSSSSNAMVKHNKPLTKAYSRQSEFRWAVVLCVAMTVTACVMVRYRSLPISGYGAGGDGDDAVPIHPLVRRKSVPKFPYRVGHHPAAAHQTRQQIIMDSSHSHNGSNDNDNHNDNDTDNNPLSCANMMQFTTKHNIRLVALDFDKTILDIHTGGRWHHRSGALVSHVRPDMVCFLQRCLQHQIPVAVATFSTQTELIQKVIAKALMIHANYYLQAPLDSSTATTATTSATLPATVEALMEMIPVFGGDDWVKGYTKGKQSQLLLAMEHFNKNQNKNDNNQEEETNKQTDPEELITPRSTLLVDDDAKNIQVAQSDGYFTILYRPAKLQE